MMRKFFRKLDDWMFDENDPDSLTVVKFMAVTVPVVVVFCLGFALLFSFFIGGDDYISLDKRDWHCTATRTELVPTLVGKVFIPEPRDMCTTWEKNQ